MKNLYRIIAIVFLGTSLTYAQEPTMEKMKETITKEYKFEKNNKEIPYSVTIVNKAKQPILLEKEDKNKLNQDRIVDVPEMITKVIKIDDSYNNSMDNMIELSYTKEAENDFNIEPSDTGFVIMVKGKEFKYSVDDKTYEVTPSNTDFFIIKKSKDMKGISGF